jgi:hypothetical protein
MRNSRSCYAPLFCSAAVFASALVFFWCAAPLHSSAQVFGTPIEAGYPAGDDWEPAIISDASGNLYVAITHASVAEEQKGVYYTQMMYQKSTDGGANWSAPAVVNPCCPANRNEEGQFDPWFTLGPDGQTVSFAFIQNYSDATEDFTTSSNGGETWSTPIDVSSKPAPLDKTVLVSKGALFAYAYTDYNSNILASISTNGGDTWKTYVIANIPGDLTQMLASGGGIDSEGNIYFTWDATWGKKHKPAPAAVWITKSADLGVSWTTTNIAYSGLPPACSSCQDREFFAPQINMTVGADDTLYLIWNSTPPGDLTNGANERIYFATSRDHARTFSDAQNISDAPAMATHCFPTVVSGATPGDVRVAWMDTRTGRWNVFYRTSTTHGRKWKQTPSVRLSTYVPGIRYLTKQGFRFPYGDYMQMTIDPKGMTHAVWGADDDMNNPGNIWVANQVK